MNDFSKHLTRNHIDIAGWPKWQRDASSCSRLFANGLAPKPCTDEGCPCHEVTKIMDRARKRCAKPTREYLDGL